MNRTENKSQDFIKEAFEFAVTNLGWVLPVNLLEKYVKASQKMKDEERLQSFRKLYQEEKKRLEEILGQIPGEDA